MTGIRKSIIFAKESSFGKGAGDNPWYVPPPGSFFSHQHTRSTNRIDAMGTRKYDAIAYGKESGTWDWSFNLDYNYLEFLNFVFDSVDLGTSTGEGEKKTVTYTLKKTDVAKIPSFCVRIVTLNKMAGGEDNSDEVLEVRGCVVKNVRFAMSAGASQWSVSMSGFNTQECFWMGKLDGTDYKTHNGQLVEFACLFNNKDTQNKDTYVANCTALQMSIDNNAEVIDATCTPFSPAYYEGKTNYAFSTSVYSNNPKMFKQRLYTGGQNVNSDMPGYDDASGGYLKSPLCKNLAPMDGISIVSYDSCCNSSTVSNSLDSDKLETAISCSNNSITWCLEGLVIKTMSWQRGEGEKILDQISSVECRSIEMKIKITGRDTLDNSDNEVSTPKGEKWDNNSNNWVNFS